MINNEDTNGSLTLIMGPMFSGKTSKLIEYYHKTCETIDKNKCLALNYALDNRYGENQIITHNNVSIDCISILDLNDFISNKKTKELFNNAEYIFINEAQFFNNLLQTILIIKNDFKKNIILCGLDLDYKREIFGELKLLEHYSNNVIYLTGKCNTLGCICPSIYTHRIVENNQQVLIGSQEYVPLCKKCYEKINN